MSRARISLTVAMAVVFALGSGGIGAAAEAQPPLTPTVCLVANPAGFDDDGMNASMLAAAEQASRQLRVELVTADPGSLDGITEVAVAWASSGDCDLIIGGSNGAAVAMHEVITGFPAQRFAVLDDGSVPPQGANDAVWVHTRADQAAFLAGYVSAATSSTGIVGVYGGMPIPPIVDYMNGYALGVDYFNATSGGTVQVLGWDVESQTGLFSYAFEDPDLGFTLAESLFGLGADTVFPVAAGTDLGSYQAAVQRALAGDEVRIVFSDGDPFEALERDQARVLLTTAEKLFDVATYHVIASVVEGSWASGVVLEDLASGGVDIAPFHRTNNQVPGSVRQALEEIRIGIIDGTIPTRP